MIMRLLLIFSASLAALSTTAGEGVEAFKELSLQQILGPVRWSEFEKAFGALASDPLNERAFQEYAAILNEARAANKAAPYLEQLLKQNPEDTAALRCILGLTYKDLLGSAVQAAEHFQEVLRLKPNDFFAHYQLASIFARDGAKSFAEAARHYAEAATAVAGLFQYADLRTRILKECGQLYYDNRQANATFVDEAIKWWDQMVSGAREYDLQTYEDLALLYRSRSLWHKVSTTYQRYFAALEKIRDKPDSQTRTRLLVQIGEAQEQERAFAPAIASYGEACERLEENHWQRRDLEKRILHCQQQAGKADEYLARLKQETTLEQRRLPALQIYARTLEQSGEFPGAAAALEEARQLAPRSVPVLNGLARLYRRLGQHERLAQVLRQQITLSPENFNAYVELAEACLAQQKTQDAEKVLKELEDSKSQLPDKYVQLARALRRYKLNPAAIAVFRKLLNSAQASLEERVEFCALCLETKGFEEHAESEARKLCDERGLNPEGYVQLAKAFRAHDRSKLAAEILTRGISHLPDPFDPSGFVINLERSDLYQKLGEGYHALAIATTFTALRTAPSLYFKRTLNDRMITLLTAHGHNHKLLYSEEEKKGDQRLFGGPNGEGLAPWIAWLNDKANEADGSVDWWLLLGQIHESVLVNAVLPAVVDKNGKPGAPRKIATSLALARQSYQKVIDSEFQHIDAHVAMARVLADPTIDEYENAINELKTLGLLNPTGQWEYLLASGDILANAGEREKALNCWKQIAENSAGEPNLSYRLGMRLFRGGSLSDALEFVGQAALISPADFRYRVTLGRLLQLQGGAAAEPDAFNKALDEISAALRLAEDSPELKGYVQPVTGDVMRARVALARQEFLTGNYAPARKHWEEAGKLLKTLRPQERSDEQAGSSDGHLDAADFEVQIARCVEAAGDRTEALRRYQQLVTAQPELLCWLRPRIMVSAQAFLEMKQGNRLPENPKGPDLAPKQAAPLSLKAAGQVALNGPVRSAVHAGGAVWAEGEAVWYLIDPKSRSLKSAQRPTEAKFARALVAPTQDGRLLYLLDGKLSLFDPLQQKVIWTTDESSAVSGVWRTLHSRGTLIMLAGAKGVSCLSLQTGQRLWEQPVLSATQLETDGRGTALLTRNATGSNELFVREGASTAQPLTLTLPGATIWLKPILAESLLLLGESVTHKIRLYDRRTLKLRGVCNTPQPLLLPPLVQGRMAYLYSAAEKTIRVMGLDLADLSVRFEVPLSPSPAADSTNIASAIDPHALPPLFWRDWLLHYDHLKQQVVALHGHSGQICRAAAFSAQPERRVQISHWLLAGDELLLIDRSGGVYFVHLE